MDSDTIAELAVEACNDKKARNTVLIKITDVSSLADWMLVSEGMSYVQVRAIINSVEDRIKEEANILPLRKEGLNEAKWALLDYGELIINVLQPYEREYYDLESFWSNGKREKYHPINR